LIGLAELERGRIQSRWALSLKSSAADPRQPVGNTQQPRRFGSARLDITVSWRNGPPMSQFQPARLPEFKTNNTCPFPAHEQNLCIGRRRGCIAAELAERIVARTESGHTIGLGLIKAEVNRLQVFRDEWLPTTRNARA
jgi:hypothetical protein